MPGLEDDNALLAKFSRPVLRSVYPRARLFRLLDQARRQPIVWISGPAGAGKTTFVASYLRARRAGALWYSLDAGDNDVGAFFYFMGLAIKSAAPAYRTPMPLLTPEYIGGLPAFTANYFREFFTRLKRPCVLVLDNLQNASQRALQEVLQQGFEQIPNGVSVLVISREELPGVFARPRVGGRIATLGWETIKLTEQESAGIIKVRRKRARSTAQTSALHRRTGGWVAGLVLLMEQTDQSQTESPPDGIAHQSIFDYFANEIFHHMEPEAQKLLLNTVFLPRVSTALARKIVDQDDCGTVLQYLARRNLFTVKHADDSFEYHPLFREFLINRANATFSRARIRTLLQRSAELLMENGEVEAAIGLLQQAEDWRAAASLAVEYAARLHSQGRAQTLEKWLRSIPEALRATDPWVLYWLGNCRFPFAPAEARDYFQQAYVLFEKQADATPLYLTWSRIIRSFIVESDEFTPIAAWVDLYPRLRGHRAPPSKSVENAGLVNYMSGLMHGRLDHPELSKCALQVEHLFQTQTDKPRRHAWATALIIYHLWRGDMRKIDKLLEQLAPIQESDTDPVGQLTWYYAKTIYEAMIGDSHESLRAATDGLALAVASGVHAVDTELLSYGIWGQLICGNVAGARGLLQRMSLPARNGRVKEAFYSHYASVVLLHEGDIARAGDEARRATQLARESGMYVGYMAHELGLAFVYARGGDLDAALQALNGVKPRAVAMDSMYFVSCCEFCEANVRRLRGEHSQALDSLRRALSLAERGGFVTAGHCPRDTAATLYSLALENDICPEYVRATIAKTRLLPPRGLMSENWPWPVRIYTLGRFLVTRDGTPLAFGSKAQKKPLALLHALAAYGGRFVSVTKLAHALWPEAEGDLASHSFETTLYRLRKLIGEESVVTYHGQLSLNHNYCWLDVWAVEQLFESPDNVPPLDVRVKRLIDLYRGPFLEGAEAPWALVERERLRFKLLGAIVQLGQSQEAAGNYESAAACYNKGIDVDPLAEELYRCLMRCYARLGRTSEALAVFLRCRKTLLSMLRIEPAPETKALWDTIKAPVS